MREQKKSESMRIQGFEGFAYFNKAEFVVTTYLPVVATDLVMEY